MSYTTAPDDRLQAVGCDQHCLSMQSNDAAHKARDEVSSEDRAETCQYACTVGQVSMS